MNAHHRLQRCDVVPGIYWYSLNEKYREYAKDIHRSGLHLLDLIRRPAGQWPQSRRGQWEFARGGRGLGEFGSEQAQRSGWRVRRARSGITSRWRLPTPEELVCWADRRSLRQVLINLIGDAMIHPGAATSRSAWSVGDGAVRIAVADTGVSGSPRKRG